MAEFQITEQEVTNDESTPLTVDASETGTEQHLEGDSTTGAKGTGTLGKDPSGLFKFLTLDATGKLHVVVSGGGSAGQLVTDGQLAVLGDVGRIAAGFDGTNYQFIKTDSAGELQIDVLTLPNVTLASQPNPFTTPIDVNISGGTSQQVLDNQLAVPLTDKGNIVAGFDGTNYQFLNVDTTGKLQVVVTGTVAATQSGAWSVGRTWTLASGTDSIDAVQSGVWTVQQGTPPWSVDVTDRTARLLGIVYGSQGQQLKQTAVNFNLQTELATGGTLYDARQIRVLTSADIVDIFDRDSRVLGRTRLWDGTNVVGVLSNRLQVEALIATGGADQDVHLVDALSVNMDVVPDVAMPAGTRGLVIAGKDLSGFTRFPTISVDPDDSKRRVEVIGKVSISVPSPPPATTSVQINADTPLSISGTSTAIYIIPSGVTFHLQQIVAGCQGDPTESGSKIEIFYRDSSSVGHLIERVYIQGFSAFGIYPDTVKSRDGTTMVGNGTTTQIRVNRVRLSGSSQEVDAVVRGYVV